MPDPSSSSVPAFGADTGPGHRADERLKDPKSIQRTVLAHAVLHEIREADSSVLPSILTEVSTVVVALPLIWFLARHLFAL